MGTIDDVVRIARGEVGYSRWDDPEQGTKYGRWYADLVGDPYFGYNGVPYCAMFVSWVLDRAGVSCAGFPGAYTPWITSAGIAEGRTVPVSQAQSGDVAMFDWEGDGVTDHTGIVVSNSGVLTTVEGNTNNGRVAVRSRSYGSVIAVIRPDYDGSSVPSGGASSAKGDPRPIEVDGKWGSDTNLAIQYYFDAPYRDARISRQNRENRGVLAACTTGWEWQSPPVTGSPTIRLLQGACGMPASEIDGVQGRDSNVALQKHLRMDELGYKIDGVLDYPSPAVAEMQRRLNDGTL